MAGATRGGTGRTESSLAAPHPEPALDMEPPATVPQVESESSDRPPPRLRRRLFDEIIGAPRDSKLVDGKAAGWDCGTESGGYFADWRQVSSSELAGARAEPPESANPSPSQPPAAIIARFSDLRRPTFRSAVHAPLRRQTVADPRELVLPARDSHPQNRRPDLPRGVRRPHHGWPPLWRINRC